MDRLLLIKALREEKALESLEKWLEQAFKFAPCACYDLALCL